MELEEALVDVGTTESAKTSDKGKDFSTDLNEDNDDGSFSKKDIVQKGVHNSSCSTPKILKNERFLDQLPGRKI